MFSNPKSIIEQHMSDASLFSIILWDQVNNFMRKQNQKDTFEQIKMFNFSDIAEVEKMIKYDDDKVYKMYKISKELLTNDIQWWESTDSKII